jgi:hypothetical protein
MIKLPRLQLGAVRLFTKRRCVNPSPYCFFAFPSGALAICLEKQSFFFNISVEFELIFAGTRAIIATCVLGFAGMGAGDNVSATT